MKFHNQSIPQLNNQTTMNPNSISSTFSVQQVSKHHYLIRGDERVKDYMNFCDVKWSNTYQGWIVHEDDEVDLIQMHMEVLDLAKEQKTKSGKKKSTTTPKTKSKPTKKKLIVSSDEESEDEKPKKKTTKKDVLYERFKRGEEISDDDDDEYVPSSEPSSETISDESDEDLEEEEEDEEEDSETEEDSDEEEEGETDPKRKKEFQFYKKGILAFGKMTERQQEKLEAVWNKTLRGWILRMSSIEKLKKMGWLEVGNETPKESKEPIKPVEVVQKPKVTKKAKEIEEKTFEEYMYALLVKGELTPEQMTEIQGIYHPGLKGVLVGINNREKLVKLGFRDTKPKEMKEMKETKEKEVVKIQFTTGEQLKVE